ncbi:hypothetical protein PTKU64_92380 (plasmid) [Paraburkholderia terrae]|uniref:Transcriptional regulator n=1 Tax=Paraburkholderia terrae TaxID=311230 RepID=A0ABM7UBC7_9BURK|nr:hypothetical protein [Paraburkholderia terrae]BCZ85563.1 hypothetical protein PTKU64_92380 [Paraburkholderia terrae]
MKFDFSAREIPNQKTAVAVHKQLLVSKPPVIAMAKFYSIMIARGLWRNQKELATGLSVSAAQVSRMLAISRLPESVLRLFVDKHLSAAEEETIRRLIRELGENVISERAKSVPHGTTVTDALAVLTTGKPALRRPVRVSVVRGKKYFRIDSADFASIAPRAGEIEQIVNAVIAADADQVSLVMSLLTLSST